MFREAGDKYRVYSRKAQLGKGVKGLEGGQQGGKAGEKKVSKKTPNILVHQMRPFSCSVREMLLPHLEMLDVTVLQ